MLKLIKVSTVWCNPCKVQDIILNPILESNPEVELVKYDAETDETYLTETYGKIMSVPTLILEKDGQVVYNSSGLHGEEQLQELISKYK